MIMVSIRIGSVRVPTCIEEGIRDEIKNGPKNRTQKMEVELKW